MVYFIFSGNTMRSNTIYSERLFIKSFQKYVKDVGNDVTRLASFDEVTEDFLAENRSEWYGF